MLPGQQSWLLQYDDTADDDTAADTAESDDDDDTAAQPPTQPTPNTTTTTMPLTTTEKDARAPAELCSFFRIENATDQACVFEEPEFIVTEMTLDTGATTHAADKKSRRVQAAEPARPSAVLREKASQRS